MYEAFSSPAGRPVEEGGAPKIRFPSTAQKKKVFDCLVL